MAHVLPQYIKPFESLEEPAIDVEVWKEATDAFDSKKYKDSVIHLLNYINPKVLKGVKTKGDIELVQTQGSAEIHLTITESMLRIHAPFLKVTEDTNVVALLRRVTEINFTMLDLAQIVLEGDELFFKYEAPLSTCQPNKIYTVLRNITFRADDYDDLFVEEYGAVFYKEPNTTPLKEKEVKETLGQIREIFSKFDEDTTYFVENRKDNYRWDAIVISLLRLSNMPYMQGKLRSEIIENIERMYNGDIDLTQRINKGLLYIKELQELSDSYYEESLYHADQFISLRWRSSPHIVEERMENHKETIDEMEAAEDHMAIAYFLYAIFLKLIYNYNLDKNYKDAIEATLTKVSGKSTEDAAPLLLELYWDMYHVTLDDNISHYTKGSSSKGSSIVGTLIWIGILGYVAYIYNDTFAAFVDKYKHLIGL